VDTVYIKIQHELSSDYLHSDKGWYGSAEWMGNTTGKNIWSWSKTNFASHNNDDQQYERYIVYVKAVDKADNALYGVEQATSSFKYRPQLPVTIIGKPSAGNYYNYETQGLDELEGTAYDSAEVHIRLQNLTSGSSFWDQTAKIWKDSNTYDGWNVEAGPWDSDGGPWFFVVSTNAWDNNSQYKLTTKGFADPLTEANWDSKSTTNKLFYSDLENPTAGNTSPANASYKNAIQNIKGTAEDSPAGIKEVKIYLKDTNYEDRYWRVTDSSWAVSAIPIWSTTTYSGNVWTFENVPAWSHGHKYKYKANAFDDINEGAGGYNEALSQEFEFTYDIISPTSVIVSPANGSVKSEQSSSSGTAVDEFPFDTVLVQIKRYIPTVKYWDGDSWELSQQWVVATDTETWHYNTPGAFWTSGSSYTIKSKAWDVAKNTQTVYDTVTFFFDNTPPTSRITQPDQDYYSSLNTVTGTSSDSMAGVGDGAGEGVRVMLRDITQGATYWGGGSWVENPADPWLVCLGSYTWTYDMEGCWNSAHKYEVTCKAVDKSDPAVWESTGALNVHTFVFDINNPTAAVTNVSEADKKNALAEIKGTCADDWAVEEITLEIRQEPGVDDLTWTGSSWTTNVHVVSPPPSVFVSSWSYNSSGVSWVTGKNYRLTVKGYDFAGNSQGTLYPVNFLFDDTDPEGEINQPVGSKNFAPAQITGTSKDNPAVSAGVEKVELMIEYLAYSTTYWSGSAWIESGSDYYFDIGDNGANWIYTVPMPTKTWTDGHSYRMNITVTDYAGNDYTPAVTTNFTYDISTPTAYIGYPANNGYYPSGYPDVISGTGYDFGVGIQEVKITLQKESNKDWWDGAVWQIEALGPYWLDANWASGSWSTTTLVSWADGETYTIIARALDAAGNQQDSYPVEISSVTFTCDTDPPSAAVTYPADDVNCRPVIKGNASDNAPGIVSTVTVRIWRAPGGGQYYDKDLGWGTDESWNNLATGTTDWFYDKSTLWTDKITYRVDAKSQDKAGNWSAVSDSVTFIVDLSSPVSKTNSPGGGKYYSTISQLDGTASDEESLGGSGVQKKDNVHLQIIDVDGNQYWVDTADNWQGYVSTPIATSFSTGTPNTWSYNDLYASDATWTHAKLAGNNLFKTRVWSEDNAGNIEELADETTFYFDNTAPDSVTTWPINGQSFNSLSQARGTCTDDTGVETHPAGVGGAKVKIWSKKDGLYWSQTDENWIGAGPDIWNTASSSTSWTSWFLDISTGAWTGQSGSSFVITSKASDKVDYSSNEETLLTSATFWIDNTPPDSLISKPAYNVPGDWYGNGITKVTGTSSDDVGIGETDIWIKKNDSDWAWDNSTWTATASPLWIQAGAAGITSWEYDFGVSGGSTKAWSPGTRYRVVSRAMDTCDYDPNYQITTSTKFFIFDNVPPTSYIVTPSSGTGYGSLATLTGTAKDENQGSYPSKVNAVKYSVQIDPNEGPPGKFYDGGTSTDSWTGETVIWLPVTNYDGGNFEWYVAFPTSAWISAHEYRLKVFSEDKVPTTANSEEGNFEEGRNQNDFSIDVLAPESKISRPVDDGNYNGTDNKLTQIYGTCTDWTGGSGVKVVELQVLDLDATPSQKYWQGGETWATFPAVWLTTSLSYDATFWWKDAPNWPSGHEYRMWSRATDNTTEPAPNVETPGYLQFIVDVLPPETKVTSPQDEKFISSLSLIDGTVSDEVGGGAKNAGVKEVHIKIIKVTNPATYYYWTGSGWLPDADNFLTNVTVTTPTWTYDEIGTGNLTPGHRYFAVPRGLDNANNMETAYSTSTFYFDNAPPKSGVSSPEDVDFRNDLTSITGTAEDQPQGEFEGATLSSAGVKEVYIRLRDATRGTTYWSVGGWTDSAQWVQVGTEDSWSYGINDWLSNHKYVLNTKAYDDMSPSNEEILISTMSFVIDRSSPTSQIDSPSDGANLSSRPTQLTGTSKDDWDEPAETRAGIDKVWVKLFDVDISSSWNSATTSWQDGDYWIETNSNEPDWAVSINTVCWTDTHQYRIWIRAQDILNTKNIILRTRPRH